MYLFYIAGGFYYLYRDGSIKSRYNAFNGQEVTIHAIVDSQPKNREFTKDYYIKVLDICGEDGNAYNIKGKILLKAYTNQNRSNNKGKEAVEDEIDDEVKDSTSIEYGYYVNLKGKLFLPAGRRNPAGFDYRRYLAIYGISAIIQTNLKDITINEDFGGSRAVQAGIAARLALTGVIDRCLPPQQAGLLNGMLIGYREGLSENVQEAFGDSGLTHIMAVSGANIAFVVFPLLFLFKKLLIRRRLSYILTISSVAGFVFITGFEASVVRAAIMAVIVLAGKIIYRESEIYNSIAIAALAMLLANPHMLLDIGFELSFAATLSIVLFHRNIKKLIDIRLIPDGIKDVLASTLAAQLGVIPISVYYFNSVSLVSLLSNLVVVPLTGLITILGFIMALTGLIFMPLAKLIGLLNCTLLSLVLYTVKLSTSFSLAAVRAPSPSLEFFIIYYAILITALYLIPSAGIPLKVLIKKYRKMTATAAVIMSMAIALLWTGILRDKRLEVVFVDVGWGDCALIRTPSGKNVLIDGGGDTKTDNPQESYIGSNITLPFLLHRGVMTLDLVIGTHGHSDHINGLLPVLDELKVKNIALPQYHEPEPFEMILARALGHEINTLYLEYGDVIMLDKDVRLEVLSPSQECAGRGPNELSVVVRLCYKDVEMLFAGDIEKETELELSQKNIMLESEVLKAGHHGSETSTIPQFLSRVNPVVAVISTGKNKFGHPSKEVLSRLSENNVKTFRTDFDGAVIIRTDGRRIYISTTHKPFLL